MLNIEDLTGMQFGDWTVLERDLKKYKSRGARYICECSCGVRKSVFGKHLRNGKSLSCGGLNHNDLSGQKFNSWTVLERDSQSKQNSMYLCRCECGVIKSVSSASLKNGDSKSCGCKRQKDYTGYRFGKLVVEKMLPVVNNVSYCECHCDCGTEGFIVSANRLVTGNTKSCGCLHKPDLTNRRFGRLTVLQQVESNTPQRKWKCLCDCGNILYLNSHTLTSGHTMSCGCIRSERTSRMEVFVSQYLRDKSIYYHPEYSFDDCIGVNGWKLRFDFYIPDRMIAIECDGIQHYKSINFFGGEKRFLERQQNDKIKNIYCSAHNIMLIRLPYFLSADDITKRLNEVFMNPVTTTAV